MNLPPYEELGPLQRSIVDSQPNQSVIVTGGPGTGKTVVALWRAKKLADRGLTVHVIVYSNLLRQFMIAGSEQLEMESVIDTYHGWLNRFFRRTYGRDLTYIEDWVVDWTDALMVVNTNPPPKGSMPFLIVDEGQDFPKELYILLRLVSKNMTVFADENQRIGGEQSTIADIQIYSQIQQVETLKANQRNTAEIIELARSLYVGQDLATMPMPDRRGSPPLMVHSASISDAVACIARYARHHPQSSIGVLVPSQIVQWQVAEALRPRTRRVVQLYRRRGNKRPPDLEFNEPVVTVVTYASAKGLEFDAVFIPELQAVEYQSASTDIKMRLYVLTTRARDDLILSYSGTGEPRILELFPDSIIRRSDCCASDSSSEVSELTAYICRRCGYEENRGRKTCFRCRYPLPEASDIS